MDRKANGSPLRVIIAVAVLAAASAGMGYIAGRVSIDPETPAVRSEPTAPPSLPEPILPEVTLGRSDIIDLANSAADAVSGGPAVHDMMEGQRFILRIPFGCGQSAPDEGERAASYTVRDETVRVRVLPEDWTDVPWIASELSRRGAAGAEGFWIPRPWTGVEACPPGATEPADRSSTLGIAQVFDAASSRVEQRRGRALEATVQVGPDEADFSKGLRLVIEGRITRWPGGRATVLCHVAGAYQRPVCLVGTKLDRISIENPANDERLADWAY